MVSRWPLKKRAPFWILLCIYLPILIIPWALTCVLNYRPLNYPYPSYNFTEALPDYYYTQMEQTYRAIRVLNSVQAYLTVPMLSMLLAYGAVIYTQRRSQKQKLSLNQTFALADRAWANIARVLSIAYPDRHYGSTYLFLGFALIAIGAHSPPHEFPSMLTKSQSFGKYSVAKYPCDPGVNSSISTLWRA